MKTWILNFSIACVILSSCFPKKSGSSGQPNATQNHNTSGNNNNTQTSGTDAGSTSGTNQGANTSGSIAAATGNDARTGANGATSGQSGVTADSGTPDDRLSNRIENKIDSSINNAPTFGPVFSVISADALTCVDYDKNFGAKGSKDAIQKQAETEKGILKDEPCSTEIAIARCNLKDSSLNGSFSFVYYYDKKTDLSQLPALVASLQLDCAQQISDTVFATFVSYIKK